MKPDIAKQLERVERAWTKSFRGTDTDGNGRIEPDAVREVNDLCDALRASRGEGAVPVLLSREVVEALRVCSDKSRLYEDAPMSAAIKLISLLARDLGDVIK